MSIHFQLSYKKFTRGKDISQFSMEDLGCILGGKKKEARKSQKKGQEDEEEPIDKTGTKFKKPDENFKLL
jgi:hypothetical protein